MFNYFLSRLLLTIFNIFVLFPTILPTLLHLQFFLLNLRNFTLDSNKLPEKPLFLFKFVICLILYLAHQFLYLYFNFMYLLFALSILLVNFINFHFLPIRPRYHQYLVWILNHVCFVVPFYHIVTAITINFLILLKVNYVRALKKASFFLQRFLYFFSFLISTILNYKHFTQIIQLLFLFVKSNIYCYLIQGLILVLVHLAQLFILANFLNFCYNCSAKSKIVTILIIKVVIFNIITIFVIHFLI